MPLLDLKSLVKKQLQPSVGTRMRVLPVTNARTNNTVTDGYLHYIINDQCISDEIENPVRKKA